MSVLVDLDTTLSNLLMNLPLQKAKRNECITQLRDVLDMYLFSVMEEEDPLYRLLHQRSEYVSSYNYKSVKILSPYSFQFKILMALPFQPDQIQVTYADPGFVKLKFPPSSDTGITGSRVWVDACNRGMRESLERHLNSWRDDCDYLKQTAFLKWFESVIDKSLSTTGKIPNYNICRLQTRGKATLMIEELSSGFKFTVELLPVIAFPLNQLPDNLSGILQDSACSEWMIECRSNAIGSDLLWGINLWQHERAFIKKNSHLKPTTQVLKCLRDGCHWNELKNYHIRTLVMTCHKLSPTMFDSLTPGAILMFLLLELRNGLVSKTGLPFFWDKDLNLLSGLNGLQRSELARSITRTRDRLQSFDESCSPMFWLNTYTPPEQGSTEGSSAANESTSSHATESQAFSHHPTAQSTTLEDNQERGRSPSEVDLQPRSHPHNSPALQMGMMQESGVDWGKIATAGAAVASAVVAIAGIAWYRNKRNN